MARIRTIKPEFFASETIAELSIAARLTFIGLWSEADDYGVCADNARIIKGHIWPLDDNVDAHAVGALLDEMLALGLVCRFEDGGKRYLHVCSFNEHQTISHPSKRRLPEPPNHQQPPETTPDQPKARSSGDTLESSRDALEPSGDTPSGKERKGKELQPERSVSGDTAEPPQPAEAPPRQDELFDALCAATNTNPAELTKPGRGQINAALQQLKTVGATPHEIETRSRRWNYPAKLTASALAKHWASLGRPTTTTAPTNLPPLHIAGTNGHTPDAGKVAELRPRRKAAT